MTNWGVAEGVAKGNRRTKRLLVEGREDTVLGSRSSKGGFEGKDKGPEDEDTAQTKAVLRTSKRSRSRWRGSRHFRSVILQYAAVSPLSGATHQQRQV